MPKNYDAEFAQVAQDVSQTISDVRYALDLVESEIAHFAKSGIMNCESHTKSDVIELLSEAQNDLGAIGAMFQLMGSYHALVKHYGELGAGIYLYMMQKDSLEQALREWKKHKLASRAPLPEQPTTEELARDSRNWLERLFKGFREGGNGG